MVAHRSFLQGSRLGTLAVLLGAAVAPADVAAQLPAAGSDPEPAAASTEESGPQAPDPRLLNPAEMASLAEAYSVDVANAVAGVESLRKNALEARDAIKASCVDNLLPEMRMIRDALAPRFRAIARRTDDFTARADFLVIAPGMERIRELRADAEACVGQAIDSWSVFAAATETPSGPSADSEAGAPPRDVIVDRPAEASIYR